MVSAIQIRWNDGGPMEVPVEGEAIKCPKTGHNLRAGFLLDRFEISMVMFKAGRKMKHSGKKRTSVKIQLSPKRPAKVPAPKGHGLNAPFRFSLERARPENIRRILEQAFA